MRNTIIAIATLIAGSAVAADLPSRSAPPAPVVQAPVSWYVGLNGGTIAGNSGTVGVNGGLQYGQYVRVEGAYDYANTGGGNLLGQNTNLLTGNFIVQYPVDQFKVTPYALAGAGYRWSSVKNEPIYNVGGGVRYGLTSNVDLDARYRYVSSTSDSTRNASVYTLGVNYKF